jgi:hypothetical protein
MDGRATFVIDPSTKSRKAIPQRSARVSLPRRVARKDGSCAAVSMVCLLAIGLYKLDGSRAGFVTGSRCHISGRSYVVRVR